MIILNRYAVLIWRYQQKMAGLLSDQKNPLSERRKMEREWEEDSIAQKANYQLWKYW